MNALLTASRLLQPIADAPVWVVLLLKVTAILSAAWLVHLALARANPRWRVFLWRVTAVGLIALPAMAWLVPALQIRLEPPPVEEPTATAAAAQGISASFRTEVPGDGGSVALVRGCPDFLPLPAPSQD